MFSRGQIPHDIVQLVKLARMTALRKKDGWVRGSVAGKVIRRLVASTIAQQLNSAAAAASAPFQYALTTRAGSECVSHAIASHLRVGRECHGDVNWWGQCVWFDFQAGHVVGVGTSSWRWNLITICAFVLLWTVSVHLGIWWRSVSHNPSRAGGEQGDPLTPHLILRRPALSIGSDSTEAASEWNSSRVLGWRVCGVSQPDKARDVHNVAEQELWTHAKIRIHAGKTHMWNRSGRMPERSDELQRRAVLHDPTAHVWRGSDLPTQDQGIKVLGVSFGSCGLRDCAIGEARANFYLRVVRPDLVVQFARTHDANLWQCTILGIPVTLCDEMAKATCNFTPCSWWNGTAKRREVAGGCPLGELGGHFAHDSRTTPSRGRVDRWISDRRSRDTMFGLSCPNGPRWRMGCAPSRAGCAEGWMATWGCQLCGTPPWCCVHLASAPRDGPCCDPRTVQLQEFFLDDSFILFDSVGTCSLPGPSPTPPSPPFALDQAPGVAVFSTPLATTVQLARGQECWGEGASHWKVQLPECAEKQGRGYKNLFVRDMDLGVPNAHDVWKWWPTVCHSLVACSLLWTPLWCLQFRRWATAEGSC